MSVVAPKISIENSDPENDKHATRATSDVASRIENADEPKPAKTPLKMAFFEEFGLWPAVDNPNAVHSENVALVLKKSASSSGVFEDCQSMTDARLHEKYKDEYDAWRNMRRRAKDGIRTVHPSFEDFRLFLITVGKKKNRSHTLDRPNNDNPEYSPTNARWASKREQNRNKGDTVIITDPETGKKWLVGALSKKHGITPDAVRARKRRGWSDAEIVAGKRLPKTYEPNVSQVLFERWETIMGHVYPDDIHTLTPTGKKMLRRFEAYCDGDCGLPTHDVLAHCVVNWSEFCDLVSVWEGIYRVNFPEMPQPKTIMAHAMAAVNFWVKPDPYGDYPGKKVYWVDHQDKAPFSFSEDDVAEML